VPVYEAVGAAATADFRTQEAGCSVKGRAECKHVLSQPVSAAAFAAVLSATAANAANIEITNVGFIGDTTDISGFVNETGADTGIILLTTTGGTIIPVFCILVNIGVSDYLHGTGNADIYAGIAGAIWELEYNTNGHTLSVTDNPTVDGLIAADVAYAEANPASYSLSLFPGANGDAFGAGQAFSSGVPEPSTWAMLLLGFAGLGFAGWRRARPKLSIVE
jgi:PEP-CTERM motif